jgi:2-isopropylmalate synthase/UPF0716 protein FxsA
MIYFFIYLFIEVMISSTIAGEIGGLNVFIEILATAILGIFILRNFKLTLVDSIAKARSGHITQEEFMKANVGKAFGAILLVVPGVFTDIIGLLLQVPFFITIISTVFKFKTPKNRASYSTNFSSSDFGYDTNRFTNTNTKNTNNSNYKRNKDEIIDVEVIDDSNTLKH